MGALMREEGPQAGLPARAEIVLASGSRTRTEMAGAALAYALRQGDVVSLTGELGAGKTVFARGVLRGLGARVEEARVRPALEYSDVKVAIAETEIYTINYPDLSTRPGDFGEDFLARALPACLFQSSDYVAASREQRRMIAEAAPLWERYDALLSVVFGPAPRLDAHDRLNFWARPNANPMANVLGCPSLAVCNGFSGNGFPLGMQLMGRPFDEATVLRAAHGYQGVTDWHKRHPAL